MKRINLDDWGKELTQLIECHFTPEHGYSDEDCYFGRDYVGVRDEDLGDYNAFYSNNFTPKEALQILIETGQLKEDKTFSRAFNEEMETIKKALEKDKKFRVEHNRMNFENWLIRRRDAES